MCTTSPTLEEDQGGSPISTTSGVCHHDVTSRRESHVVIHPNIIHNDDVWRLCANVQLDLIEMQVGVAFIWHVVVDDNIDLTVQYIQHYTVIHDQKYSLKWNTSLVLHWSFLFNYHVALKVRMTCLFGSTLLSFQHIKATVSFQKSFAAMIHNDHSSNLGFSILTPFSISPFISANSHLWAPHTPSLCLLIQKRVRQSPGLPALSMSIPRPKRSVATRMRFWNSLNCLYLPGMMLNDAKCRQAIGGWRVAEVDSQHVKLRRREE